MTKTTSKYSPEVRERAVRMVLDGAGQHEAVGRRLCRLRRRLAARRKR